MKVGEKQEETKGGGGGGGGGGAPSSENNDQEAYAFALLQWTSKHTKRLKRMLFVTTKNHNKAAQAKSDTYRTSHFSQFNCCLSVVL